MPLVFVHHGYTMSAQNMYDITGYAALADSEHIAVAFPDGQGGPTRSARRGTSAPNVCPASAARRPMRPATTSRSSTRSRPTSRTISASIPSHVFVTGFSMGGYFAHHAGCMRDDIRAVAPHSGGTHAARELHDADKPIIIFHGAVGSA